MDRPAAIVNIYFPTAVNNPMPEIDTVLVIRPRTPSGAHLITIWVMFIITSNTAVKKFRKKVECLVSILVSPTPRKMAKNIIPSMSPEEILDEMFAY